MQLSAHFSLSEFQREDELIPPVCIPMFQLLCTEILEPVRARFNCPLIVTSGYRSPEGNQKAHGQPNSEHIADGTKCACDFYPASVGGLVTAQDIFDEMRNDPKLPYHQLIYEKGQYGAVIHVSINTRMPGIRSVLQGMTHNSSAYTPVDHVTYDV